MKVRRRARIVALQALFEVDTVHHSPDAVLQWRLEEVPLPAAGESFARRLVYGVLEHRPMLDVVIQRIAPEWPDVKCVFPGGQHPWREQVPAMPMLARAQALGAAVTSLFQIRYEPGAA